MAIVAAKLFFKRIGSFKASCHYPVYTTELKLVVTFFRKDHECEQGRCAEKAD